jgi:hypothetical protein
MMKKPINRALPIRSPLSLLSLRIGLPLLASAFALTASLSSSASEFGAHEHGIANLAIAQEGKEVSVSFSAAADSVLGYEHPPTNDQEHTSLAHAKEVFSHPERWLALPASCVLESKDVDLPFMAEAGHENHDHDHDEEAHDDHDEEAHDDHDEEAHDDHDHDEGDHDHDGHDHSTHVNVEARYTFHCDSDALSPATLKLFSQLPYLELLRIEAISERTVVVSEQEGDGNLEW